ncbi:MAG TPA: CBS domain-containing protein [Verrucomicrobiae bacterium]|nr:CBS domain-containing protein [Verrucomicrobiae bacterium]
MKVRDIMVETPRYCRPDANLITAAETMSVGNCSLLPVVDQEGKVVGIITDRDICMTLAGKNQKPSDLRVRDAMSGRVRRLPVVGRDGSSVGMISLGDVSV